MAPVGAELLSQVSAIAEGAMDNKDRRTLGAAVALLLALPAATPAPGSGRIVGRVPDGTTEEFVTFDVRRGGARR